MMTRNKTSFKGKVVAVSGSGNVAQYAIEKATQFGAKVVTASDSERRDLRSDRDHEREARLLDGVEEREARSHRGIHEEVQG
jgi:glutamate dehydrogenase (NADP+)